MSDIGSVESLWRYPVKSMHGEALEQVFFGFSGVYGDRLCVFHDTQGRAGFPWLTGRELRDMILFTPRFRDAANSYMPPNLEAAQNLAPGVAPMYASADDLVIDVNTPSGTTFAVDDPALAQLLATQLGRSSAPQLRRSDKGFADCRPLSLFSLQTARQLGSEVGFEVDPRRFRANVYLDLGDAEGFAEDALVGQRLQLGEQVVISVLERDPRCAMVTLDPDTAESNPKILRQIAQGHETSAGVYGAVLSEGIVRSGDRVIVL
jgi:uncharacterized protein